MKKRAPKTNKDQSSVQESELSPSQIETILKPYNDDIKRHMMALSEDFQGKVAMVAEQVIGLHEKYDTLIDKVDKQGAKLDEVIHIQETHTEMIGAIMEDVSEIKIELKNKADKVEVARLERRVQSLV